VTPEAVFKAYDLLASIPHEQVMHLRQILARLRRNALMRAVGTSVSQGVALVWSSEDAALAWVIDITDGKTVVWTNRRVNEGLELTDETIH
jgi:hypothetical protein